MINDNNFLGTVNNYLNNSPKNYIIVKDSDFKIIESPKIINNDDNDLDNLKIANEQFIDAIYDFVTIIERHTDILHLNTFFENLKTLTIEKTGFMLFKKAAPGTYNIPQNKIILRRNDGLKSIYHELLHCASRKKSKNTYFAGFYQYNSNGKIGIGLNEGYTALLEESFFDKTGSYNLNRILCKALEEIVGKEKMYKFYFEADLFGLINELKNYIEEEKTISFLIDLDNFTDFSINRKPFNKHDEMIKRIVEFLLQCFSNKTINLIDNNLITDDERYELINNFAKLLDYKCTVNKWEFDLLPEEMLDKINIPSFKKEDNKNKAI